MNAEIQKIESAARLSFGDFTESRSLEPPRSYLLAQMAIGLFALALPAATLFYFL